MPRYWNEAGLEFTTSNEAAVHAFDACIRSYATFRRDIGDHLKAAFAADANMVMAHVLKGYFFHYMGLRALLPKAEKCLADAEAASIGCGPRERNHIEALRAWCKGDYRTALDVWERTLIEFPRDFLALKLANYLHFYLGDSANVRDCVARVLHAWDNAMPGYGLVRSLYAFGLQENGAFAEAEAIARASLASDPLDGWAVHTVAHAMEAQDRNEEGLAFLSEHEAHWDSGNNFRYHLWWHRALFHIDAREHDAALELYDRRLWDAQSDEYLDLCNDASLLLRLELAGADVGDRWGALFEKVRARTGDHIFAFIDAHFMMALAAVDANAADTMLGSLREQVMRGQNTTAAITRDIGYALCQAIAAHRARDYAQVVKLLAPNRYRIRAIGGSNTQRDVFFRMLVDAAIRDNQNDLARALLSEYATRRAKSAWVARAAGLRH
jgi:tetratricopeptide (TPR) repeat protein